jgi:aerobic carbon-monoxide dehydrogenase large subunit
MNINSYVGQPIERIEDLRLLRGRGQFVDDLHFDGMLHAAILRSAVPHGRILNLNTAQALTLPGVVAVITAAEFGGAVPTIPLRLAPLIDLVPYEQPVIANGKVRYVGEPLAVVVAGSAAIAEDALELIALEIEPLPPCVDTHTAAANQSLLFEETGTNLALTYTAALGDAAAAFAAATTDDFHIRRERLSTQRHTATTMETRGLIGVWDSKKQHLTVYGAAKVPFASRGILARQIGLPESAIDLIEGDVGGGFGMRGEFYPEDFLIPFAARFVNRPVKWIEDRREHLLTCNHAREFDCDLELLCRRDGTILAVRGHVNGNIGAYIRANATIAPRNVAQFFSGPYRIPNIHIESSMLVTNKTPTGTYRGPGRFEGDFFRERLFDIVAEDLGIDPVAFRRRNLITSDELPTKLAAITPVRQQDELDCGDYLQTLDRCLGEFGWAEKAKLKGKLIDGRYHGVGIACFIEGGGVGPRENARMVVEGDGSISVYVGSAIVGQGLETICTQIAADALELPMDQIKIFHGSTTYLHEGFGSFGSRSTVMGGSAIIAAADKLKETIRTAAALRLNCAADDIVLEAGLAASPDGNVVRWTDLAPENLQSDGTFFCDRRTYGYGAHAAHVAVDPRTGHVELVDYVAVGDVGRIVNPKTLHGQIVGAIVQGLGSTFLEHLVYDKDGQLLTGSLADYLVPTATDYPNIRVFDQEEYPSPNNPLGAKGAGEGGIIPVGGVIANAIASALGVQPKSLPMSPSRVWELINPGGESAEPG